MVYQFTFKRFEKALRYRVVPAVAFSTHTLHHGSTLQLSLEFSAGVLYTAAADRPDLNEKAIGLVSLCF